METKIYGYAARDAEVSSGGSVVSSRVYIYDEKPHLETRVKMENGHVTSTEHVWHSSSRCYPAPYGSFTNLNWFDKPKKVLLFIVSDVDYAEDEDGNPIVGSENVSLVVSR